MLEILLFLLLVVRGPDLPVRCLGLPCEVLLSVILLILRWVVGLGLRGKTRCRVCFLRRELIQIVFWALFLRFLRLGFCRVWVRLGVLFSRALFIVVISLLGLLGGFVGVGGLWILNPVVIVLVAIIVVLLIVALLIVIVASILPVVVRPLGLARMGSLPLLFGVASSWFALLGVRLRGLGVVCLGGVGLRDRLLRFFAVEITVFVLPFHI